MAIKCCFCGEDAGVYGHNPEPLKPAEERCCDNCNRDKVVPERIRVSKEISLFDAPKEEDEVFWLDGWNGNAQGGYYVRNDLFKMVEKCKNNGLKVVGIKVGDGWNLEVICEKVKKEVEKDGTGIENDEKGS